MTTAQICSLAATCLNITIISVYVRATYRGSIQPNLVSWSLWALAPAIGVAGALSKGYWWGALPTFAAGFGPMLVLTAAILGKNGFWKISRGDWFCALLSLLALLLWAITQKVEIAILFAILSDGFASVPTLKKAWQHPESESVCGYAGGLIGSTISLFTLNDWAFAECGFPLYLIAVNFSLISFLLSGRKRIQQTTN